MKIKLKTLVKSHYKQVFENFNKELFIRLKPPFVNINVLRFDGCKVGDEVHLKLITPFFRQNWISLITDFSKDLEEIYFIDEGKKLPFFLKSWEHKHRILRRNNHSEIIDEITYRTHFFLLDLLMYPVFYFQFFARKKVYREFFNS